MLILKQEFQVWKDLFIKKEDKITYTKKDDIAVIFFLLQ